MSHFFSSSRWYCGVHMDLSIFGRRILSPPRPPPGPSIEMVSSPGVAERERPPAADDASPAAPDLRGDWPNFFLLILLYVMQGIPLGLSSAVPILLQGNKNVSYSDQVTTTLVRPKRFGPVDADGRGRDQNGRKKKPNCGRDQNGREKSQPRRLGLCGWEFVVLR